MNRHPLQLLRHPLLLAALTLLLSCGLPEVLREGLKRLSNAIDNTARTIGNASASWQLELPKLIDQIDNDANGTIREFRDSVNLLMSKGIAATGAEARCTADQMGAMIHKGLLDILADIQAKLDGTEPPPKQPLPLVVCSAVPEALDRAAADEGRVLTVNFYGVGFIEWRGSIKALVVDENGERDVTALLNWVSNYLVVLPLGSKGVQVTERSQRITLRWLDRESSVAVIHPKPTVKICKRQSTQYTPPDLGFMPPCHPYPNQVTDNDFNGHGPKMDVKVTLGREEGSIKATLWMEALEWAAGAPRANFTRAEGSMVREIYAVPYGWRIIDLRSSAQDEVHTIDTTTNEADLFTGSGCIREFDLYGDRGGGDCEEYTRVEVKFKELELLLEEDERTTGCVTQKTLQSLAQGGHLSRYWQERLAQLPPG